MVAGRRRGSPLIRRASRMLREVDSSNSNSVLSPDHPQWLDWRWQMRNAIRSRTELEKHIPLSEEERAGCDGTASLFRLGITPYYLSLIDPNHPFCPIRMQAIPTRAEAQIHPGELRDPLGEDQARPVT